jgi:DnaJ-class molecular chaperone
MTYNYEREWREYADWCEEVALEEYCKHQNICYSCGGWGDSGVEPEILWLPETGLLYICFTCGGSGKYFVDDASH